MASERMSCSEIRFWAGILLEPPNDSSYQLTSEKRSERLGNSENELSVGQVKKHLLCQMPSK
jgi:hypothetical protein